MPLSQQEILAQLDRRKTKVPIVPPSYKEHMPSVIPNVPPGADPRTFENLLASVSGRSDAATLETMARQANRRDYKAMVEAEKRLAKVKETLKNTKRPKFEVPVGQPNFVTNNIPVPVGSGKKKGKAGGHNHVHDGVVPSAKGQGAIGNRKPINTSGPGWKDPTPVNRGQISTTNVRRYNWKGRTLVLNPQMADNFIGFLNELTAKGYKVHSLGSHSVRGNTSDPSVLSMHAYGLAIDINPAQNPYGSKLITDMPPGVGRLAAKYGLQWGGNWNTVKDAMHFSMKGGFGGSAG